MWWLIRGPVCPIASVDGARSSTGLRLAESRLEVLVGSIGRFADRTRSYHPGMRRLIKALVGMLVVGWIVAFAWSLAIALRLKREAPLPPETAADEVDLVVAFDQLEFRSTATGFVGGRLDCLFGGAIVDLRDATVAASGARLEGRAMFGGAQLIVPDGWRVTWTSRGIFGGIGDSRPARDRPDDAPHLDIDAFSLFGGFGITSQADRVAGTTRRDRVVSADDFTGPEES